MTATCLQGKGWDVKADEDHPGQLILPGEGIPASQDSAFTADSKACDKALGLDVFIPFTEKEARIAYRHELKTAKCLTQQGYSVSNPVSESVFIKDFTTNPQGDYWNPWLDVPGLTPQEMSELDKKCPQNPIEFTG